MSDRPLIGDTSTARAETRVLRGIVYVALVALLLVLGARMFISGEKNVDESTTQPGTEAPLPG
jgi:hypothetical protein